MIDSSPLPQLPSPFYIYVSLIEGLRAFFSDMSAYLSTNFSATSHPFPWKWELHASLVPLEEDYFDYLPITAALWPSVQGLQGFLTLTIENVSQFHFSDLKVNVWKVICLI